MLIDEDEESSQARDDEVNAAGGEELSEAHDAVSDTEAAAAVTADALEGAMVDDYLDGLTTNTNTGYRSQSWDEGVRVAVPAEEPGQSTMQPTSTVADVHVSAPTEDMSDVEPSGTTGRDTTMPTCGVVFRNVSPSSLQEVKIPVARRCRGRPKGTDKSLNVKYGLAQSWKKRTPKLQHTEAVVLPDEIQSQQSVESEAVTGATRVRRSAVRKRRLPHTTTSQSTSQSVSASATDNCAECGLLEPRKKGKGSKTVNWIQCDKCQFWYHTCCVPAMPRNSDDDYVCVRCE